MFSAPAEAGAWDGVAMAFALDTAPTLMEYLDAVWHALRPGGVWVSCGPLSWHWEGDGGDDRFSRSVALCWTEVRHAICARGFAVQDEVVVESGYGDNELALRRTRFSCVLFTATKPGV